MAKITGKTVMRGTKHGGGGNGRGQKSKKKKNLIPRIPSSLWVLGGKTGRGPCRLPALLIIYMLVFDHGGP